MSSPAKKTGGGGGGWGSLFTGAITNLESRLDTILADDPNASAADKTKTNLTRANSGRLAAPKAASSTQGSRDASRSRVNDRLAERLAKATQKPPSRVSTPTNDGGSGRTSADTRRSVEIPKSAPDLEADQLPKQEKAAGEKDAAVEGKQPAQEERGSLATSTLPINPARVSLDSAVPSAGVVSGETSARPSIDVPNGLETPPKSAAELQAAMNQMQADYTQAEAQRQEEMHAYLERIDALQAKLTYLANETVAAAKEANAATGVNTLERQLAEKDQQIALLMQEGEKLSKTEMKHLQTIKKLRTKGVEDDKVTAELKKRLERAERSEADLKAKIRKTDVTERQANEKTKQIAAIEKQVEELKVDRENASELVRSLTTQLKEAKEKAAKAENSSKSLEVDKNRIADLENELEDAQIEKKLAEDRADTEIKKAKEEVERQREGFSVKELEWKNEISGLESRLEAMRARAEEASATDGGSAEGESSVKLMRQVETLQQQYALAKGNWETIEGSLNARVAALENERDEMSKRESEIRKKAREVGVKARKVEDEKESALDRVKSLEEDLSACKAQLAALQSRLQQAEASHAETKADVDRQRKQWEAEMSQRLEEERSKSRREILSPASRTESPNYFSRKGSSVDVRQPKSRLTSHDLAALHTEQRSTSRRSSNIASASASRQESFSPSLSRQDSYDASSPQAVHPTPSIEIGISEAGDFEESSPQRTIADLMSTSTAGPGVGPSVQLVERMSALVRKLESEKASFRDELARLGAQRDAARAEVVDLMREMEGKKKVEEAEKAMEGLQGRYEASLEMLGEKEEEVAELRADVVELKRIYRELVEVKVGGGNASL
ncbi:unnamed protein product [Zymoseptoria tritici ST99CH_3D1]|uniref:TATA element modulatory factor 1 TATA binding domain-containing protein n=1 Tax=Zymoseptoria tritici ST99CH_1E4 TaxID=1276532 RepID=A0A2H1FNB9_ZYMTR|nr:unnamed protein product [Zymoseptoria tritici ST99CH_1E4]SMR45004.1 unnamed protein product [Zymoseptoria tritici ST99CH_3D1]